MDIYDIVFLSVGIVIIGFVSLLMLISYFEKEKQAVKKTLYLLVALIPILLIPFFNFPFQNQLEIGLLSVMIVSFLLLFVPYNNFSNIQNYSFKNRIDERDIMFSRVKLVKGTPRYKKYYKNNPSKQLLDDQIRDLPGLLSENTTFYNKFLFSAANSSFKTVKAFHSNLYSPVNSKKTIYDINILSSFIKKWTKKLGAIDCGITELKEYHKYTKQGREDNYGKKTNLNHKYAIAFTVEMDSSMIASAPGGSTVMESAFQYLNAGGIAMQLSYFIKDLGYDALAHIDGKYKIVCPLVAKDAGLGEIGRMGLLMTPNHGPRVRIGVVTTDIPLVIDKPTFEPSVIDFCSICKKCATVCPGKAIATDERKMINGDLRWQINQEKCYKYWASCGTDCGRCLVVCPYSHPDNFLHKMVRKALENSFLFRKFALKMDDYLYGKKPKPKEAFDWVRKIEK